MSVSAAGLEGYSAVVEQLSQYATSQSSANLLNNEATRYLTQQLNQGFASVRCKWNHRILLILCFAGFAPRILLSFEIRQSPPVPPCNDFLLLHAYE